MNDQKFYESCDALFKDPSEFEATPKMLASLVYAIELALPLGNQMDRIKRSLAYGEKLREYVPMEQLDFLTGRMEVDGFMSGDDEKLILHALLGTITEAFEKMEILLEWLEGKRLNKKGMVVELGDGWFYDVLLARLLGCTEEQVRQVNHDRLHKVRYPDGYNDKDAVNRDEEAEKAALDEILPI